MTFESDAQQLISQKFISSINQIYHAQNFSITSLSLTLWVNSLLERLFGLIYDKPDSSQAQILERMSLLWLLNVLQLECATRWHSLKKKKHLIFIFFIQLFTICLYYIFNVKLDMLESNMFIMKIMGRRKIWNSWVVWYFLDKYALKQDATRYSIKEFFFFIKHHSSV
jgi:hypothetical protein